MMRMYRMLRSPAQHQRSSGLERRALAGRVSHQLGTHAGQGGDALLSILMGHASAAAMLRPALGLLLVLNLIPLTLLVGSACLFGALGYAAEAPKPDGTVSVRVESWVPRGGGFGYTWGTGC
jgi:hypothetical protein